MLAWLIYESIMIEHLCSFLVQIPLHYTTTRWSTFPLYALFCNFLLIFDAFHKIILIKHSMILLLEGECYIIHNWWTDDILNRSLKRFIKMLYDSLINVTSNNKHRYIISYILIYRYIKMKKSIFVSWIGICT